MKIGIVCPYDLGAHGGVQQLCLELAGRLRGVGEEVILAAPGHGEGWVSLGAVVSVVANGSRVPVTLSPVAGRRLRHGLAGVDVIHVHEPLVPVAGWSALSAGRPTVVTFHADPPGWARRLYHVCRSRWSDRFENTAVTAVSGVAASALPSEWGSVEIIPNAIDVGSYRVDVKRYPKRVAFLGRDDPRKGLDVVLEAWPQVVAVHPEAELVVIGASRSHPAVRVQFTGRVREAEKRSLLASSTVFVAPNLGGESFGIVVAEAMAAGCAVLASDLEAFRGVARDAAAYATPGSPTDWAEQLTTLLGSPKRTAALQRAGVDAARQFDWPRILDRYLALYRRVSDG